VPETVVSSHIEVTAAGAGELQAREGKEVGGGVVMGGFYGGSAVYVEVLGAESRRWG